MNLSTRASNILIGALALIIIAVSLAFILGKVTGPSGAAAPAAAATAPAATVTLTQAVSTGTVTVPGQPQTQSGTTFQESPLKIIDMNVTPATVAAGGAVTFTARVQGANQAIAYAVLMSGDGGTGFTFPIAGSGGQSGDVKTYTFNTAAPKTPGAYRYYVRAIDLNGASIANSEDAIQLKVT